MFKESNPIRTNRRDSILILSDILLHAIHGIRISDLMFRARLSSAQTNKYMLVLLKAELLETSFEKKRLLYRATAKGKSFLEKSNTLQKLMT